MKVLVTKKLLSEDIEYIQERLTPTIELVFPENYDESTLLKYIHDVEVIFGGFFSEELLKLAKKLKFAQIPWTGVDNLDFDLLKKFNVILCNSHSNAQMVAEHAVAMMMDAAKKISYHDRELRKGNWNRLFPNSKNLVSPFSKNITGSKVAIIGFGAIGRYIYKMLKGFDCRFSVFTRSGSVPEMKLGEVESLKITDFFTNSRDIDFVFVAIPLTPETNGMIDNKFFHAMSDTCILINVSRGQVLNPADLYHALSNKLLGAAAIDTWYNYPTPSNPIVFPSLDYPFHELDNLVLSPHRAGYVDSGFPHLDDAIRNLNRAVAGENLINIVSLDRNY